MKLNNFSKKLFSGMSKRSPEILMALGIAGMFGAIVIAIKDTPKAIKKIDDEYERRIAEAEKVSAYPPFEEVMPKKDVIKTVWKCYIPTAVTGILSASCIIGANSIHAGRNAALTTAYALSETALRSYREKVIEAVGDVKEREIREQASRRNPEHSKDESHITFIGNGEVLCYDIPSDRYFKTTKNKLERVENELNRRMRDEMYVSLNDYYYEVGLKSVSSNEGWNINDGYLDLHIGAHITDDGTPCLSVDFHTSPKPNYQNLS